MNKYLKQLREKSGLTQQEVADKLGYASKQFVSNWERGICLPPTHSINDLATIFSCDSKDLKKFYLKAKSDLLIEKMR